MIKRPQETIRPETVIKNSTAGMIRFLGLTRWWLEELTEHERSVIEEHFLPGRGTLTQGEVFASSDTPRHYLRAIAGWVQRHDPTLASRVLAAAELASSRRRSGPPRASQS